LEKLIDGQPEYSISALELEQEGSLLKDIFLELNSLEWQRTHNDLSYQ
jgi:hypothetical protein